MIGSKNTGGASLMFTLSCLMSSAINTKSPAVTVHPAIAIVAAFKARLAKGAFSNGSTLWCVKCFGLAFGKIVDCIMFPLFSLNGGTDIKG